MARYTVTTYRWIKVFQTHAIEVDADDVLAAEDIAGEEGIGRDEWTDASTEETLRTVSVTLIPEPAK